MQYWNETEGAVLLWIQEHLRTDWLTPWMKTITFFGDSGILWIVLTIALLGISFVHVRKYSHSGDLSEPDMLAYWKRNLRTGMMCALALALMLVINNLFLKNLIARIRPYEVVQELTYLVKKPDDFSFPSGHTAASFAVAWVFLRRLPKKIGVPSIILAVLIGLSRMYVGVHYPTDVMGGLVLGILYGEIGIRTISHIWESGF